MKAILNNQWGFVLLVLAFALLTAALLYQFVLHGGG